MVVVLALLLVPHMALASATDTFEHQTVSLGIESGLIAHYTFDGDFSDQSGNGNHATNYGASRFRSAGAGHGEVDGGL